MSKIKKNNIQKLFRSSIMQKNTYALGPNLENVFFKTQTHQTEDEMHKSILFSENRVSRSPIILIRLRSRSPISFLGLRLRLRNPDLRSLNLLQKIALLIHKSMKC